MKIRSAISTIRISTITLLFLFAFVATSCNDHGQDGEVKILFLHHSTGRIIWQGGDRPLVARAAGKISPELAKKIENRSGLPGLIAKHNKTSEVKYSVSKAEFPKKSPYGWNNYPFDYYNIWVKNSDKDYYMEEPTLEILTKNNQVIIFKHCYPVSNIQPDLDSADIDSEVKTLANYKLQYMALRDKLREFPDTKFILFTGAAQVKSKITEEEAMRAREFFTWVKDEWDQPDDNIFIWDLYNLETDGGLYFKEEYSRSSTDSHPGSEFAEKAVNLLFNRILDIVETSGKNTSVTGERV